MKLIIIFCLFYINLYSQNINTKNNLIINHGDITLFLSDDTCTMVSKHTITYSNFLKLDSGRDNKWFQDTYKGKYIETKYIKTGFDKGHLTPSSITSYDSVVNKNSFSMFNEAPQYAYFNEHPWKNLEMSVEDTIAKYKKDAIIITGVIYNENNKKYLPKSKIKIPTHYYKIVIISKIVYVWLGVNADGKKNCKITQSNLFDLNKLFVNNKMQLIIK